MHCMRVSFDAKLSKVYTEHLGMENVDKLETSPEERAEIFQQEASKAQQVDKDTKKKTWIINVKYWQAVEAAILIIIAIIIWGLFSLPSVLYLERKSANKETTTLANTTCTAVPYMNNESVCYSFLLQYKSCNSAVNGSNGVFISSNVNVQESENIASELKILQNLLSPQCRAVSLPFICLYLFPLCGENGTVHLPSSEQCNSISTDICKGEWVMAQEVISSLPNCALLPNVSSCNLGLIANSSSSPVVQKINCSENFFFNGNYCLPSCPNWVLRTTSAFVDDGFVVIAAAIGIICGILFFIISCLHYKRMFVFPSLLVVYQTAVCILLAIFAIVNSVDTKALYCTAPDWLATLKNPSPFCAVAGSVLYWCVIQIAVLWMCHVCIIFWTVKYPVHYMRCTANHQMKYIHASVAVVAIIIPAIVVAVAFATGGFVNNRFPPVLCLSRNADAGFFSLVLPISIITPSGVSLLLIVFWTLHKKHGLERNRQSKSPMPLGTAEIKILIIFSYYFLLGSIVLAAIELDAKVYSNLVTAIALYFACESTAPGNCDSFRNNALKYTYHSLTNTAYIFLALFPLVNLVYAINFSDLKELCCTKCRTKKSADVVLTSVTMVEKSSQNNV